MMSYANKSYPSESYLYKELSCKSYLDRDSEPTISLVRYELIGLKLPL